MAVSMVSYRVRWVQDGEPRTSGVSYDLASAEHRQARLEAEGATDIEIFKVKPGE